MDDWTRQQLKNAAHKPEPEPEASNDFALGLIADNAELRAKFGIK